MVAFCNTVTAVVTDLGTAGSIVSASRDTVVLGQRERALFTRIALPEPTHIVFIHIAIGPSRDQACSKGLH